MIEHARINPSSPNLEFALISERVVNSIAIGRLSNERARTIFQKAVGFFDEALRGAETTNTLRLSATSSRDLWAYELGVKALQNISSFQDQDAHQAIEDLRSVTERISDNHTNEVNPTDLQNLEEFFTVIKQITSKAQQTRQFDRVRIGVPE